MKDVRIGLKLMGGMALLLILVLSGLGYISFDRSSAVATNMLRENIQLMASSGARIVRGELDKRLQAVEALAAREDFKSMDWAVQRPVLEGEVKRLGVMQMGVAGPDGTAPLHDGTVSNIADRGYFKQAMEGRALVSDVVIHKILKRPVMVVIAPVKSAEGKVSGAVFAVMDATLLSEATDGIKFGAKGYSYIIDGKGALIAHGNRQFVLDQRNFIEEGKTKPEFTRLGQMMQRMVKGESGFDEYNFMGADRFFGFAPVPGTAWSIAVGAMREDVMADVRVLGKTIGLASGAALLLSLLAALFISRLITVPIGKLMTFAEAVAGGDLKAVSGVSQKDEIGRLNDSVQRMLAALVEKMDEAREQSRLAAEETAKAVKATGEAEEARKHAEEARKQGMLQAADRVAGVVEGLTAASEQLRAQVQQAAEGTEGQKRRVMETVTAMEEMNATVIEVARHAADSAAEAESANQKARHGERSVQEVITAIEAVRTQAGTLQSSMKSLGGQAEDIGRIIGVIEDIADQTNLLALNAAIEAARAGDAGRGFAVVADEVRKLAEKTMTATQQVGQAISSIQGEARASVQATAQATEAVARSTSLAEQSGEALADIVGIVSNTAAKVTSIATAAEQQSATSEEINRSVSDISHISNETAQTMNESTRAIAELTRQSADLKALVEDLRS